MRKLFTLLLCLLVSLPAYALHTRQDVRDAYAEAISSRVETIFISEPLAKSPYMTGELDMALISQAADYLNFLRWLAYLGGDVQINAEMCDTCQHGAVLLSALGKASHDAENPGDMPEGFYAEANYATRSSNLAAIPWLSDRILLDALDYFAHDGGETNLSTLGHRRLILNPRMAQTGFGLAARANEMSFITMYAHDETGANGVWDAVCWPSPGAFPAEYMYDIFVRGEFAWSVMLDSNVYDIDASKPSIIMKELNSGAVFTLNAATGYQSDGYFSIARGSYGAGGAACLVFMPLLGKSGAGEYRQNQVWSVEISGLAGVDGTQRALSYTVELMSLQYIDPASVEISHTALSLEAGEAFALTANVIPDWADDVSVSWRTSDPDIAAVDEFGNVQALSAGSCVIEAVSANGRIDACALNVLG